MNKIQRGNIAELMVILEVTKYNYIANIPYTHDSRYDLIVDNGIKLSKIQIKRAYETNNHDKVSLCCETRRFVGNNKTDTYSEGNYDYLIAVDVKNYIFWIIPYSEVKKYKAQLYLWQAKFDIFKNNWKF